MSEYKKFTTGALKDKKDRRDYRISGIAGSVNIPKQVFELKEEFPPKNQHTRPSCTSQGQTHHKERQERSPRSARFIMALTKQKEGNTNEGAYTRNTFKITKEFGSCSEAIMPEPSADMSWEEYIKVDAIPAEAYKDANNHKSASYWRVDGGIDGIRQVLTKYGNSVEVTMNWYREFNRPDNGILPDNYVNSVGGHAIEACGFDDFKQLLKLKNSWGRSWGKDGYFYMPYSMFPKVVWDAWCSLDIPENVAVDTYYGIKRTWDSFLREKAMAFNPWLAGKLGRLPNNREIKGLAYGFWSYSAVFEGKYGDLWLHKTKPQATKDGDLNN